MASRRASVLCPLYHVSAGGVVFRGRGPDARICLIARKSNGRTIWCLPKGHVEKGEKLERTAIREVREETGISGAARAPIGSIRYTFFDLESKKRVFKTVYFYLIHYLKGKLSDHDDEIEYARWFPISKALKQLDYEGECKVLKKAILMLRKL